MPKAFITGVSGTELTSAEVSFLKSARPAGVILFARNLASREQIRRLVAAVLDAVGEEILILIDEEGGRVQRLRPPLGRALPPAAAYGRLYDLSPERGMEAAFLAARLLAEDLLGLGINTDCAPVLDVPVPGSHDIIGDRAYGADPAKVAALGRAVAQGLMAGGVVPVIKHIPGHGRATKDSHHDLPVVETAHEELARTDFRAFKELAAMPAAMTAHVVFTSIDAANPASTSQHVTREIIRGEIGFDGLLMSDDLSMKALSGSFATRTKAVLEAGSDLALHCNGLMPEMQAVAAEAPELTGPPLARYRRALAVLAKRTPFDAARAEALIAEARQAGASRAESV